MTIAEKSLNPETEKAPKKKKRKANKKELIIVPVLKYQYFTPVPWCLGP